MSPQRKLELEKTARDLVDDIQMIAMDQAEMLVYLAIIEQYAKQFIEGKRK